MDSTRIAIVGGDGAVGRLLAGVLRDAGREVVVVDPAATPPLDARRPSPALTAALATADCVVLAVPEAVALDALPHVLAAMRPGALLADTLSVKTRFLAAALAADAPVELLSLNPMFAPDLGLEGRAVLAVEAAPGPRSAALLALLRERATVVAVADAAGHDRLTAALQVATHASVIGFGMALVELDADLDTLLAVAPPPFLALLALLARIVSGNPETYADIQLANPYAREARVALADSAGYLVDAVAVGGGAAHLELLLRRLAEVLGDARGPLAEQAAALLSQVRPPR
jgi:prephenate dehydrogenase